MKEFNGIHKDDKLDLILDYAVRLDIAPASIAKAGIMSLPAARDLLEGKTKKPHESTLDKVLKFLEDHGNRNLIKVNPLAETVAMLREQMVSKDKIILLLEDKIKSMGTK